MMFTQEQLEEIKSVARKSKNQGELAIIRYFLAGDIQHIDAPPIFSDEQWNIVKYCAEECKRQHSGEMSVYDMVNAWNWASFYTNNDTGEGRVDLTFIENVGIRVEPIDNKKGFRTIPIGVTDGYGGWIEKAQWERVPHLLEALLVSYYDGSLNPDNAFANEPVGEIYGYHLLSKRAEDQFYYEYENIHPFRDGNGRSGKILYNYLCGTLDNPIMPPNFWGGSNP